MNDDDVEGPYTQFVSESDDPPLRVPTEAVPAGRIGELLVRMGVLLPRDVDFVLQLQKAGTERFGEIAIRLSLARPEQVAAALARQSNFPVVPAGGSSISPTVTTAYRPDGRVAESIRTLRTQLLSRWYSGPKVWPALAITGVERGEGRSFVAANLAVAFAQMGRRTLLIDANLRDPIQHELFNLPSRVGLAGILAGRAGLGEIFALERMPGLAVLPAGPRLPNPQELISRDRLGSLLQDFVNRFDVVLIDTPAASESADAQLLAIQARGALLVARRDVTRSRQLIAHQGDLEQVGVCVVGVAYNDW